MAPWVYLDNEPIADHDHHWHRYTPDHDDWMSIWADHKWGETWWVEIYPIDNGDTDVRKTTHVGFEEAAQRVADLMEEYNE